MAFALLAATILQLPFEIRSPLFVVGGLTITNLELTAYAALVACGWVALRRNRRFDRVDWALLAWAAAWVVAGLAAPWDHAGALKHAARLAVGPVLAIFARAALNPGEPARLLRWFGLAAGAAAATALGELRLPDVADALLAPFRERATTSIFGRRTAGPFEHANQLAAVLGTALPLAVVVLTDRATALRRAGLALAAAGTLALLFTMSRGGWAAGAVGLGLALVLSRRALGVPRARRIAVGLIALVLAAFLVSSRLRGRLLHPWISPPFSAMLSYAPAPSPRIVAINTGSSDWVHAGDGRIRLSVYGRRLTPPHREREVFLDLPADVRPGGRVEIPIDPAGTLPPGKYLHVYELVHPVFGHGSQWEIPPLSGETEIRDGRAILRYGQGGGPLRRPRPERGDLWDAAWRAFRERPLFGIGPAQFQAYSYRWLPAHGHDPRLHPNQQLLHHLAEGGLLAGLGWLGLILAAGIALGKRVAARVPDPVAAAGLGALAAWLVHGILDSFILFNGTTLAWWVALGCATAVPATRPRRRTR